MLALKGHRVRRTGWFIGGVALLGVVLTGCNDPGSGAPSGVDPGGQPVVGSAAVPGGLTPEETRARSTDAVHLSSPILYNPTTTQPPTVDQEMDTIRAALVAQCGADQCGITVRSDAQCADQHGSDCLETTITPALSAGGTRIPPGSTIIVSGSDTAYGLGDTTTTDTTTTENGVSSTTDPADTPSG